MDKRHLMIGVRFHEVRSVESPSRRSEMMSFWMPSNSKGLHCVMCHLLARVSKCASIVRDFLFLVMMLKAPSLMNMNNSYTCTETDWIIECQNFLNQRIQIRIFLDGNNGLKLVTPKQDV